MARRGGCVGRARTVAAARPRSRCRLTRKRPTPRTRCDASAIPVSAGTAPGRAGERRQDRLLDLLARERRRSGSGSDAAVDAQRRRGAGDEEQVAARAGRTSSSSQRSRRTASAGSPAMGAPAGAVGVQLPNQPVDVLGVVHRGSSEGIRNPRSGRPSGIAGSGRRRQTLMADEGSRPPAAAAVRRRHVPAEEGPPGRGRLERPRSGARGARVLRPTASGATARSSCRARGDRRSS